MDLIMYLLPLYWKDIILKKKLYNPKTSRALHVSKIHVQIHVDILMLISQFIITFRQDHYDRKMLGRQPFPCFYVC